MRLPAVVLAILAVTPLAASLQDAPAAWLLVQYDGPIPAEEHAFLAAHAEVVLDPVPPFGYVAKLSADGRAALLARAAIAAIEPFPLDSKAPPDLGSAPDDVHILLFPDADPRAVASHLGREGAAAIPLAAREPLLEARLGSLPLAHLLAHAEVRWVERAPGPATLDNARASSIVQSGLDEAWSVHARGIDGSSQVIGYCDTGLDTNAPLGSGVGWARHEMFADPAMPLVQNAPLPHRKVALYYAPVDAGGLRGDLDDADGHGTHVAGTLAGDAGTWGARDGSDGVAYGARLAVCDAMRGASFQLLADYAGYWQPAYDAGARVHSNSWGTSMTASYSLAARQHDAYAWTHRDLVILRSMGNAGPDGPMRQEAAAKNVLAIGATRNDATADGVESFSARGPAADGRVKPDLVAPGSCVRSADVSSPTSYVCWSGTSYATPVAAGAAALVRDYFAKGLHPSGAPVPADALSASSALVRAVLVASAVPVAAPSPDGLEGWGRPQLDRALAFPGDEHALVAHDEGAALETGDAWTTTVALEAGASLRVVLAWTDAPAAPGATVALVNDLDLVIVAPGGAVVHGNADLVVPDRVNVVERASLTADVAGDYTLRVRAWNVPMGPQPFALVAVVVDAP